jgi:hypothetical protein
MSDGAQNLSRRDMMRLGATGVAAASIANLPVLAAEQAAADKLPKRRYGRTGLEIGWLVGASDWPKELIPRAVNAGVTYWHKAQKWTADTLPPVLKRFSRMHRENRIISSVSWTASTETITAARSMKSSTTSSSRAA